jgi:5-methylcytosine-specific restriction endonuclease McrA
VSEYKRPSQSEAQRKRVLERDGHACVKCGGTDGLEVDHRIPLHVTAIADKKLIEYLRSDQNCQTLCATCHKVKTHRSDRPWRKKIRRGGKPKQAKSKIRSRGFDKKLKRRFDGKVVERHGKGNDKDQD